MRHALTAQNIFRVNPRQKRRLALKKRAFVRHKKIPFTPKFGFGVGFSCYSFFISAPARLYDFHACAPVQSYFPYEVNFSTNMILVRSEKHEVKKRNTQSKKQNKPARKTFDTSSSNRTLSNRALT